MIPSIAILPIWKQYNLEFTSEEEQLMKDVLKAVYLNEEEKVKECLNQIQSLPITSRIKIERVLILSNEIADYNLRLQGEENETVDPG